MVAEMDKRKNKVILSLGGNVGDVIKTLQEAIIIINNEIGKVKNVSPVYQTKAWGVENQPDFLNITLVLNTSLLPQRVIEKCLQIENNLGRVRSKKWFERTIDIDILFYNESVINSENLTVPHPYIAERNFVLYPLADILPNFKHPVLLKTIKTLKKECSDQLKVHKCLDKLLII